MSDEDRPPWEERSNKTEAMFIHYCMHKGCKKWGAWGFAGHHRIEWFCFEHRGDGLKTPK